MKRKISICILLIAVITVVAVLFFVNMSKPAPEEHTELAATEETQIEEAAPASTSTTYAFLLKEQDGWVVVCTPESGEVYMETGIRAGSLPAELRDRLSEGIGFSDEAELFDFLESYSS